PARPGDVAAGVGPRACGQRGRALAATGSWRAGADAPGDRPALRRVRAPPGGAAHAAAAATGRGTRVRPRGPGAGARPGGRGHVHRNAAAHQRVRVRHDCPARAAARRDDAHHPPPPQAPGPAVLPAHPPRAPPADALSLPREVLIPGGPFTMGTSTEPWALDNERPAHPVTVPAFYLDTTPVTNAAYAGFIAAGGYDDRRWWS